jgi:hypothetical protein
MRLTIVSLFIGGASALLIYSGVTDRHPVEVMKAILTGSTIPAAGSWGGGTIGRATRPAAGDPNVGSAGGSTAGAGKTPAN